jgi:hypothetical protein
MHPQPRRRSLEQRHIAFPPLMLAAQSVDCPGRADPSKVLRTCIG